MLLHLSHFKLRMAAPFLIPSSWEEKTWYNTSTILQQRLK
jgi:hypothetical protein